MSPVLWNCNEFPSGGENKVIFDPGVKVGMWDIGSTFTPAQPLDINIGGNASQVYIGPAGGGFYLSCASTHQFQISGGAVRDAGGNWIATDAAPSLIGSWLGTIYFFTDTHKNGPFTPLERMRITSTGLIGINNTNPLKQLDVGGDANFSGAVTASNNIKVYDSGWFDVGALSQRIKDHGLGTFPKGVIILFAPTLNPTQVTIAGPNPIAFTSLDYGAFVSSITVTQITVRAGDRYGYDPGIPGWAQALTTGYYKIIAWA